MANYAKGIYADGWCQICALPYPYLELRINPRFPQQKLLVCQTCLDPYDPQEWPFPPAIDPIALPRPVPDPTNPAETVPLAMFSTFGGDSTTGVTFVTYQGGNASSTEADYGFSALYGGTSLSGQYGI